MRPRPGLEQWLSALLLGALVIWGVWLRLEDPLSTRALPAEDPYTHVVFTKEWASQGYFADSFYLGTSMYPPGMHAFLAVISPFTGMSLYTLARFGPALLGGLAILGMYVLGSRLANRAAGLAAAFATAIIPEHIFRTELLFPTAFDLALLPLWIFAFHLMLTSERGAGAILFAGASLPVALMHPWVVPLVGAPLAVYAGVRALRAHEPFRSTLRSLGLPVGLVVLATSFAVATRWDEADTGFADFAAKVPGLAGASSWDLPGPVAFLLVLPLLATLAALGLALVATIASVRAPRAVRVGASGVVGVGLLALVFPLTRSLPRDVDYLQMFGPLAIALGLAGFALAFARPSALGDLGVAFSTLLFPLTALDLFGSPYWPQRTVAYFAIGVALLAANVAGQLYELAGALARSDRARRAAGPAAIVALSLAGAGAATALPVDTYEWYRLYDEDDFRGFELASAIVAGEPQAKVFVYSWQPALVVKTLAAPELVWYSPAFFADGGTRASQVDDVNGPAYVLVDRYTLDAAKKGKADVGFLDDARKYRLVAQSGETELHEVIG